MGGQPRANWTEFSVAFDGWAFGGKCLDDGVEMVHLFSNLARARDCLLLKGICDGVK